MSTTDDPQLAYARWLERGARLGLVVLVASFAAYAFGLVEPHVPRDRLPAVWSLPLADYLAATGMPTGWGWLPLAAVRGDLAGLLGIAVLAGCSLAALVAATLAYARQGDRVHALLCVAVATIIGLAASGWLVAGHA